MLTNGASDPAYSPAEPASVSPKFLRSGRQFAAWYEDRFGGLSGGVVPPMGLEKNGVDLLEIDGLGLVAHGYDESAPMQRLRTARSVPSALRVMRLMASSVKMRRGTGPRGLGATWIDLSANPIGRIAIR